MSYYEWSSSKAVGATFVFLFPAPTIFRFQQSSTNARGMLQKKPRSESALLHCGIEANRANWVWPYIEATLNTLQQTAPGATFEDVRDMFENRWGSKGAPLLRCASAMHDRKFVSLCMLVLANAGQPEWQTAAGMLTGKIHRALGHTWGTPCAMLAQSACANTTFACSGGNKSVRCQGEQERCSEGWPNQCHTDTHIATLAGCACLCCHGPGASLWKSSRV